MDRRSRQSGAIHPRRRLLNSVVNPFIRKIEEFPERILLFDDVEADKRRVAELSRNRPIFLELGSGSGRHLLERASQNSVAAFFGFELRYKRAVRTIEKALEKNIENVFVLHRDARLLADCFSTVEGIYVNFPDPWERKRDAKHRLFAPWLIDATCSVLSIEGFLAIKTDHLESFERFCEEVLADGRLKKLSDGEISGSEGANGCSPALENIETEFEALFRAQKKPIARAIFIRT
jgi:tRNA (guanine-N7-)-methyltransferase